MGKQLKIYLNQIQTWEQGSFVDSWIFDNWTKKKKAEVNKQCKRWVRPGRNDNTICDCPNPKDAKWIASRLNLASVLEQMVCDYATGKIDGTEIIKFAKKKYKIKQK